jgi:hypothetical protein
MDNPFHLDWSAYLPNFLGDVCSHFFRITPPLRKLTGMGVSGRTDASQGQALKELSLRETFEKISIAISNRNGMV